MNIDFDKLDEQGMQDVRDALFRARRKVEKIRKGSVRRHPTPEQIDTFRAVRELEESEIRDAFKASDYRQSRNQSKSWSHFLSELSNDEPAE